MQNFEAMALVLGCIGTLCWMVCFWWMHRISSHQDAMLKELHEMTRRIEKLSRAEHDLISDVHPQVNEIKEHVENVREVVSPKKNRPRLDLSRETASLADAIQLYEKIHLSTVGAARFAACEQKKTTVTHPPAGKREQYHDCKSTFGHHQERENRGEC